MAVSENIKSSIEEVKRINRRRICFELKKQIVPIISYFSSILSIIVLAFFNGNQFHFNFRSIWDYILLGVCLLLLVVGTCNIVKEIKLEDDFDVSRDELHHLLTVARYNASCSIINVAGDLSWLSSDFETLKSIKEINPELKITIFYDKKYVQESSMIMIDYLKENHIARLIPYSDYHIAMKFMITDFSFEPEMKSQSKIFVYPKSDGARFDKKFETRFLWKSFNTKDREIYMSLWSMLNILEKVSDQHFRLGISGVNNVGKTTIAKRCLARLTSKYATRLYDDYFDNYNGKTLYDNLCIILSQQIQEQTCDSEINIFDRPLIDNFFYLCMREEELRESYSNTKSNKKHLTHLHPSIEYIYESMLHNVSMQMKKYDLILFIRKKNDMFDVSTSNVQSAQRKRIHTMLSNFYNSADFKGRVLVYDVDHNDFDNSIDEIVNLVVNEIDKIYNIREYTM